ncbi:YqjF family protein [Streptomyces sp. NPDC003042]
MNTTPPGGPPPAVAPHAVRLPMLTMHWRYQTMVHWRCPEEAVQALLPPALRADLFDGSAWVSITPFVMSDVKLVGLLTLPRSDFAETNLRTYVRRPDGSGGLWFLSLDVANPLMLAARCVGVPYHLADLTVQADGESLRYSGRRQDGAGTYRIHVRPGAPVDEAAPLDRWLTARWSAYSMRAGRLWRTPVQHEPWPLYHGSLVELEQSLTDSAGLPPPVGRPLVHTSPGVGPVRIGPSRPAR